MKYYFYHYYFSHFLPLHLNGERKSGKMLAGPVSLYNIVPRLRCYFHKSIFPRRKS